MNSQLKRQKEKFMHTAKPIGMKIHETKTEAIKAIKEFAQINNSSMNKITYEEYQRMWFALQYGIINEQEWREFCDAVFAQTLEENKDVMVRLKNR